MALEHSQVSGYKVNVTRRDQLLSCAETHDTGTRTALKPQQRTKAPDRQDTWLLSGCLHTKMCLPGAASKGVGARETVEIKRQCFPVSHTATHWSLKQQPVPMKKNLSPKIQELALGHTGPEADKAGVYIIWLPGQLYSAKV